MLRWTGLRGHRYRRRYALGIFLARQRSKGKPRKYHGHREVRRYGRNRHSPVVGSVSRRESRNNSGLESSDGHVQAEIKPRTAMPTRDRMRRREFITLLGSAVSLRVTAFLLVADRFGDRAANTGRTI